MKTSILAAIGLVITSSVPVARASIDLISPTVKNGSFELGSFVANADPGTMKVPAGSSVITDWSVQPFYVGDSLGALAWIEAGNTFGLTAAEGSRFLDLSGYRDNQPYGGVLTAVSLNTVVNQKYLVTFQLGSDYRYDGTVTPKVAVGIASGYSALVFANVFTSSALNPTDQNRWEKESFVFTATDSKTALWFQGDAASAVKYIGLDDVRITAVPEAPTLIAGALLLLPLGASVLRVLRRNNAV